MTSSRRTGSSSLVFGSEAIKAFSQRRFGSASTKIAFMNWVAGRASSAPSGPRVKAHTSSDRNDTVEVTPTASPVNLGWMIDWKMKFDSEYKATTSASPVRPFVRKAMIAAGSSPITKPMFGM